MQCLLVLAALVAVGSCNMPCPGCPMQVPDNDLRTKLTTLLNTQVPNLPPGCTVENIQTQVVSGMKYIYTIRCPGRLDTCVVEIVEQAWLHSVNVEHNTCTQLAVSKKQLGGGSLMGGWSPVPDLTRDEYQKALHCALDRVNHMSNNMYKLVALNAVEPPTQQVVAGMNYHLKMRLVESSCRQSVSGYDTCQVSANPAMQPLTMEANVFMPLFGAQCSVTEFKLTPA